MSAMNDHARLLSSAIATSRLRLLPFLVLMYVLAFIDRANVGYARAFLRKPTPASAMPPSRSARAHLLHRLCLLRGTQQPDAAPPRRQGLAVQDHGHLGPGLGGDDVRRRRHDFLCPALPAGRRRGGLLPGIILYLTYWFPQRSRAQALGLFYFGLPLALVLGGPLSGWLLEFHGIFGLANWQWLFVTEGLLASLVGIAAYFYLVDRPRDAGWLSDEQKRALEGELAEEDTRKQARGPHGFLSALRSGQVLKFCLVYFTIQMSVYGVVFLPADPHRQLPRRPGRPERRPDHRDSPGLRPGGNAPGDPPGRPQRPASPARGGHARAWPQPVSPPRRWPASLDLAVIAFASPRPASSRAAAVLDPSTGYLSGAAAASGIALINSLGNLGGFVAPNLKTLMESQFADPRAGMFALAAVGLLGACLLFG